MKNICLLLCLGLYAHFSFSQDPVLTDNNWYIDYMFIDDTEHPSPIGGIGIIDPNLYFETSDVYGIIDPFSDSFFAQVDYHPTDPIFTLFDMGITLPGCQAYCEFAGLYFQLLAGDFIENTFEYSVVNNSDGSLSLTITDMEGDFAVFNDFPPLGIEDFSNDSIQIYPNPVSEILNINSKLPWSEFFVYDMWGRQVLEGGSSTSSMDVSELHSGTYLIMIEAGMDRFIKKFTKN